MMLAWVARMRAERERVMGGGSLLARLAYVLAAPLFFLLGVGWMQVGINFIWLGGYVFEMVNVQDGGMAMAIFVGLFIGLFGMLWFSLGSMLVMTTVWRVLDLCAVYLLRLERR